jgi:hypothetical protein
MDGEVEEILAYLDYIQSQNRLVSIVNTFKGVSYSYTVNIVNVSHQEETIMVAAPPRHNLSLLPNMDVTIHSDLFPHPILACVSTVDVPRRTAIICPFEYQRSMTDNRNHARVQIKDKLLVSIRGEEDFQITALVHDLSIQGMSILINSTGIDKEDHLQSGEKLNLSFRLRLSVTASLKPIDFQAKIIYTQPFNTDKLRVGLQTYPTPREILAIRRYIFDRQTEFFRELANSSGELKPS